MSSNGNACTGNCNSVRSTGIGNNAYTWCVVLSAADTHSLREDAIDWGQWGPPGCRADGRPLGPAATCARIISHRGQFCVT